MAHRQSRFRTLRRPLAAAAVAILAQAAELRASSLLVDGGGYTGSFALQVIVDDTSPAWVQDLSAGAAKRYRARFYVRLSGLDQPPGTEFNLFIGTTITGVEQFRLMVGASATQRQLRLAAWRDDGSFIETPPGGEIRLANGWRALEVDWRAASAPGANDGALAVWVDGQAFAGLSGLDNDTGELSSVRWGAVTGLDSGTLGSFRLDDFESRRSLPIGLVSVFSDVPRIDPFWRFVLSIYNAGVTGGCGSGLFCPANAVTREQMALFLLRSKEGDEYMAPACTAPPFGDVPVSSPFCRWIRELAARSITGGCAPDAYCPSASVTREQMAVFLLVAREGSGYVPPLCSSAPFADVSPSSPYCPWIQELVRRGITGGCGPDSYCPNASVTRGQMAVFLAATFALPVPVP